MLRSAIEGLAEAWVDYDLLARRPSGSVATLHALVQAEETLELAVRFYRDAHSDFLTLRRLLEDLRLFGENNVPWRHDPTYGAWLRARKEIP